MKPLEQIDRLLSSFEVVNGSLQPHVPETIGNTSAVHCEVARRCSSWQAAHRRESLASLQCTSQYIMTDLMMAHLCTATELAHIRESAAAELRAAKALPYDP